MDLRLADLTVLITGASGGIGRGLAEVFAAEGSRLVLHGHHGLPGLEAWVAQQPWRDRALCVGADITRPEEVAAAFAAGEARFGRVDVAVANAGVWPKPHEHLDQASPERIVNTLTIDLLGAAWTARAWMAGLRRLGPRADGVGASLCFIGSTAGEFGEAGHADYAMAKAGLHGLVRSLKNEVVHVDPFARVNLVQPGWTATHMVREELAVDGAIGSILRTMPLKQLARAVDVARAVAVLSSPVASRHLSGQVVTVAGGMEGRVQWDAAAVDEGAVRQRLQQD